MSQQSVGTDYEYDTTGRLSAADNKMMSQVCFAFSEGDSTENDASSPMKLSTTPQDTSFMTEEKMKKILMPKKIQF
eukprot:CAMPEP_0172371130 /NCGR_PEP_ID=MMETSP1060-20121228/41255_1 /TAXON_ID=37318 /ORGANISM="Pseudo-nitzschia pungens, Strain cf. cingulata" /LENGTH=75 /DNA_ID=CAMNT_0013096653 /DNA_START=122 /DNA_END=349 /DNA_ORIENTATION=+